MRTELFNRSKYRDGADAGDDVPLVIPGLAYGVFDGATDARGTRINGVSAGRTAALVVAAETAALAQDPGICDMDGHAVIDRLAAALRREIHDPDLPIPPSTTIAIAFDCGEAWRFLLLGDTGLRLNGSEVFRHGKLIDEVSTVARVTAFTHLRSRISDMDAVEAAARSCILLGLDNAVVEGLLSVAEVNGIVEKATQETGLGGYAEVVETFLHGGIQTQYRFGNATGNPLCFDTLNGTESTLSALQDLKRPKSEVASFELFSDGYEALGDKPSVEAWEAAFARTEAVDPHRTDQFANVKGSTSEQFFDDRTVLIVHSDKV